MIEIWGKDTHMGSKGLKIFKALGSNLVNIFKALRSRGKEKVLAHWKRITSRFN